VRVLVTGASGYIGRHVVPILLDAGHDVHTLTRQGRGIPGCTSHAGDLLTRDAPDAIINTVRPDAVLHLAWEATPGVYWTSPDNPAWADATRALVLAARAHGTRRFVGVGSCAEYDWTPGHCEEGVTPEVPATPSVGRKPEACRAVAVTNHPGFSTAWGRVFFLFGGDEHPSRLVPSVAQAILQHTPALCSHGEQVRDFLHVQDVAGAVVALLHTSVEGVVNIASGESHRVRDVIEGVAQRLGRPDLVRLGARATSEPPVLTAAAHRLRDEVGWQPGLSFDAALDAATNYWRQQ